MSKRRDVPSFDPPPATRGRAAGWVYRSGDAASAQPGSAGARPKAPARKRAPKAAKSEPPAARRLEGPPAAPAERAAVEAPALADGRAAAALRIVNRHAWYAGGVGLLPIPIVDVAGTTAVQLKMLRDLGGVYGVPFARHRAKSVLTALVGGVVPIGLAGGVVGVVLSSLPLVGPSLRVLAVPGFSTAATYAVGRVFIDHLEAGGTLADFDPERARPRFNDELERARRRGTARAAQDA